MATYNIGPGQTYTTFTALIAAINLQPGDGVDGGGNTFRERWVPDGSGASGSDIILQNATIYGSDNLSAVSWLFVSGTEYKTAKAVTVNSCTHDNEWLAVGTAGALSVGQFAYSGGYLHVNIGSNPTGANIEAAARANAVLVTDKSYVKCYGITALVVNESAFRIDGTGSNNIVVGCTAKWCGLDGVDVFDAQTSVLIDASTISHCYDILAGAGDGISFHSTSSGIISNTIIEYCEYGVNHISSGGITHKSNIIRNCSANPVLLSGTTAGNYYFYNNILSCLNPGAKSIEIISGSTATINIFNNVLTASTNDLTRGIRQRSALATVVAKNNIITGFATGVYENGGPVVGDYNLYYENTVDWNGATGIGAHSIIGQNPLFNGVTDYSLQSTSPCLNAGTDVGITSDYLGRRVPIGSAPDIGAYESAVFDQMQTPASASVSYGSIVKIYSSELDLQQITG